MIDALAAGLDALRRIGGDDRGITRLAWTPELARAEAWFCERAEASGARVERDPAGNLWACPPADPPWWGVGSHLDTVRGGGAYDGALGVVAGLEVARRSAAPVAVLAFADEEGARFNTPTFGSRALAGRPNVPLDRVDDDGVSLAEALAAAGLDPERVGEAEAGLGRLRGFLELHIDQCRDVDRLAVPAAGVRGLAARTRVRAHLRGRADHAGTTPMDEREDALDAAARLLVGALDAASDGMRVTGTRILVSPNAPTTIPADVRLWIDARAADPGALDAWVQSLRGPVAVESRSDGVAFDPRVRTALTGGLPEVVCFAGHDAGILAERMPAGMLLVRNERGVSHAPDEEVALEDAARAAEAMLRALEVLA